MPFRTKTVAHSKFAEVAAEGRYKFDELFAFLDHVRSEVGRLDADRVLIDCSKVEGHVPEVDRFEGGQRVAEIFGSWIRVALIMAPGTVTKLGELTAVNRGARLLVTDSRTEAVAWLVADD